MLRRRLLRKESAPGPRGIELAIGLRKLTTSPLRFLTSLERKFGDIVCLRLGLQDIFLVTAPSLIEESLRKPDLVSRGRIAKRAREVIGPSLIVSEGPGWAKNRKLLASCFRGTTTGGLYAAIESAAVDMAARWEVLGTSEFDVEAEIRRFTLDSTFRALFGDPLPEGKDADVLGEALTDALDLTVRRAREVLPLPLWLPTERHESFRRTRVEADRLIARKLRDVEHNGSDLCIAAMLMGGDPQGQRLTEEEIRAELFGLLFSGYESPTRAITWMLSLVASHPAHMEKLWAGLDASDGSSFRTIANASLKETMRLYPPGWMLGRETTRSAVLGGVSIPEGSFLMYSAWVTHRRPDLWVNPQRFDPQRFVEGPERSPGSYKYFPFGFPPNGCIGAQFAMRQAEYVLREVLRRFVLRPVGVRPEPIAEATIRPRDRFRIKLEKR